MPVSAQALQAAYAMLSGAVLGLAYDMFRALRRCSKRRYVRGALDAAFCIFAACALFVFSLTAGEGRLRGFMLCCLGAGWGVYLLTLSRPVNGFFVRQVERLGKMLYMLRSKLDIIRKIKKIVKSIFSKIRIGFKMMYKRRRHSHAAQYEGSVRREAHKGRYDYTAGGGRPVSVRPGGHGRRLGGDREIQSDEGSVQRKGAGVGGGKRRS